VLQNYVCGEKTKCTINRGRITENLNAVLKLRPWFRFEDVAVVLCENLSFWPSTYPDST
jgi:hypothetical protein